MNITTNDNRGLSLMDIRFFKEKLFYFITKRSHTSLIQALALLQGCYPFIDLGHMYLNLIFFDNFDNFDVIDDFDIFDNFK